jgi:hypothetical protein
MELDQTLRGPSRHFLREFTTGWPRPNRAERSRPREPNRWSDWNRRLRIYFFSFFYGKRPNTTIPSGPLGRPSCGSATGEIPARDRRGRGQSRITGGGRATCSTGAQWKTEREAAQLALWAAAERDEERQDEEGFLVDVLESLIDTARTEKRSAYGAKSRSGRAPGALAHT